MSAIAEKTQAKHTPGPWKVFDNGFFFDIKVPWKKLASWQVPGLIEDHSPSICQVYYDGCDEIQGKPNAQLIAAAPELFEALEAIAQAAIEVNDPDDFEVFRSKIFSKACAALGAVNREVLER